jgi:hypothetical protein
METEKRFFPSISRKMALALMLAAGDKPNLRECHHTSKPSR